MRCVRLLLFRSVRILLFIFVLIPFPLFSQSWTAKVDKDVHFYQPTELGVLVVGTEKSLYAIDSASGETLWRRKDVDLDETDIAPVPGTDLVVFVCVFVCVELVLLVSFEKGDKARIEAMILLAPTLALGVATRSVA